MRPSRPNYLQLQILPAFMLSRVRSLIARQTPEEHRRVAGRRSRPGRETLHHTAPMVEGRAEEE